MVSITFCKAITPPPCYDAANKTDCPNRRINCHATCNAFLEYQKTKEQEVKKQMKKMRGLRDIREYYHAKKRRLRWISNNGKR